MSWRPWAAAKRLRYQTTLSPPGRYTELVSASVGPSGEAVAVWTDAQGLRAAGREGEPFWTARLAGATTLTLSGRTHVVEFSGFAGAAPDAQPLPGGRVLLVGGWARWRPEGPDHNAFIYSADGKLELTACVGDGIEHIRTTRSGAIWIGYSDMGIYGNNGWGEADSPKPVGASGLVRFCADLKPEWEYPGGSLSLEDHPELAISDCEALTIAGDTVWAYTYVECPVVCVDGEQVRSWRCSGRDRPDTSGVRSIATDGHQVALVGGYLDRDVGRVVLVDLERDRWVRRLKARLVFPDGSRLDPKAHIQGVGDTLHVFVGPDWFQVTVSELSTERR